MRTFAKGNKARRTERTERFDALGVTATDLCRMVQRRMQAAGLPAGRSPHSFRVTVATDLLGQNGPLDQVQYVLGHADPRTTRLYDRRQQRVS